MQNSRTQLRRTIAAIAIAAGLAAAAFFAGIPGVADSPWQLATRKEQLQKRLNALKAENDTVEPFQTHMAELDVQTKAMREQIVALRAIIPDEVQAQQFQATIQKDGKAAGVQVREFTAMAPVEREFFTEAPFQVNVEGPYDGVVNFFNRVARELRLGSVSGLMLTPAATQQAGTQTRRDTRFAGRCVVTTYFAKPRT